MWSCSYLCIPPVLQLEDPGAKAQAWRTLFNKGKATGFPLSLITASILAYVSYLSPSTTMSRLYAGIALVPFGVGPFTVIFIQPTNNYLLGRAEAADKKQIVAEKEETQINEAIVRWRGLNYYRTLIPAFAIALTSFGILNQQW
jgi:hypothetical protein